MADSVEIRSPGETLTYGYRNSPRYWNIVTQTTCLSISTICVGMRMYTKLLITRAPGWEDCSCFVAWLGLIGYVVIALEADKYGNGVHKWEVDKSDLQEYAKLANASQLTYGPLIFITKLSILLLYLRVFAPSAKSKTFFLIQTLIWCNFCYYLADMLVGIFECIPRAKFWDKSVRGHCVNINILILVTPTINLVSDVFILILPLVSVWRLQMKFSRKMGTSAVFATGIFACICSAIRVVVSVQTRNTKDNTFDWFPEFLWTTAEVASGIIAGCLPALPTLFSHFFKRAKSIISYLNPDDSSPQPTGHRLRYENRSRGDFGVTEPCSSNNWEMQDIEQRQDVQEAQIFQGILKTVEVNVASQEG